MVELVADLGPLFLVHIGLRDVGYRLAVLGVRDLVRVVGVEARLDALFLGQPRQPVVIGVGRCPAVLAPVPVELLTRRPPGLA
jgi:hypothetical protein